MTKTDLQSLSIHKFAALRPAAPRSAATVLRTDGRHWVDVVTCHVADFLDPNTSPDIVKRDFDELLRLGPAASDFRVRHPSGSVCNGYG